MWSHCLSVFGFFFQPIALTISRIYIYRSIPRRCKTHFQPPPSPFHFHPHPAPLHCQSPYLSFALLLFPSFVPLPSLNFNPPPLLCVSNPPPPLFFVIFFFSVSPYPYTPLCFYPLFLSLTNQYPDTQFISSTFSPSQIPSVRKHGQTFKSHHTR